MKRKKQPYYFTKTIFILALTVHTANAIDLPDPDIFDGSLDLYKTPRPQTKAEKQKEDKSSVSSEKSMEKKSEQNSSSSDSMEAAAGEPNQHSSNTTIKEKGSHRNISSKKPLPVTIGDDAETIKVEIPEDMSPEIIEQKSNPIDSQNVKAVKKKDSAPKTSGIQSTKRNDSVGVESGEPLPTEL